MTLEEKIITILPAKNENSLSAAVIACSCGCKENEITQVIKSLIEKGVDIQNVYSPYAENEVLYYIAGRSARIREECFSTFSPARFYLQQLEISRLMSSLRTLADRLERSVET